MFVNSRPTFGRKGRLTEQRLLLAKVFRASSDSADSMTWPLLVASSLPARSSAMTTTRSRTSSKSQPNGSLGELVGQVTTMWPPHRSSVRFSMRRQDLGERDRSSVLKTGLACLGRGRGSGR